MPRKSRPKKAEIRKFNPAQFVYIKHAFRAEICNRLVGWAEYKGLGPATFVDGSHRDNVSVYFQKRNGELPEDLTELFPRIEDLAQKIAPFFNIRVWPSKMEEIQIARYLPGDYYGEHVDHDSGLQNLEHDRKLSLFCSLTPNGQFTVDGEEWGVGLGDAIIFPSWVEHAAPVQQHGSRYSFVAWIPGPSWT